jgi:hypothetical protein
MKGRPIGTMDARKTTPGIRSTGQPGPIILKATSPTLQTAQTKIQVKPAP